MRRPDQSQREAAPFVRRAREFTTIAAMVRLYCRCHHGMEGGRLCRDCGALHDYARRRLERCVFGEDKPTCAKCTVHCYKAAMRERVRTVMRWAGPRMLWHHPVMTVRHFIAERRPAPQLHRPR
jgi:Nitrous oxide-stimulated promoter